MSDYTVLDNIIKDASFEQYAYGDAEAPTAKDLWAIIETLAKHIYELNRTILSHPELGPLHRRK